MTDHTHTLTDAWDEYVGGLDHPPTWIEAFEAGFLAARAAATPDNDTLAAALYRLEWDADLYATPRNHVTERYERRAARLLAALSADPTPTEDRSAGRWCEECQQHGSHHTDRHDEFAADPTPTEENES